MIPWVEVESAAIPGGSGALRLMRRGTDFSIRLGGIELMTSRESGSERALAELTLARLGEVARPRVLIGGLGMGFTLRAALALLPAEAEVVVAELVPEVVSWARGPLSALFDDSLDDPRVRVVEQDVGLVMAAGAFDAILLDVDNGPAGQVRPANDALYSGTGLAIARAALRAAGLLAIWSVEPDEAFAARFRRVGFTVEELRPRAAGRRGARHMVWIGRKL